MFEKKVETVDRDKLAHCEDLVFTLYKAAQEKAFRTEGAFGLVRLGAAAAKEADVIAVDCTKEEGTYSFLDIRAGIAGHLAFDWLPKMLTNLETMTTLEAAAKASE